MTLLKEHPFVLAGAGGSILFAAGMGVLLNSAGVVLLVLGLATMALTFCAWMAHKAESP